MTRTRGSLGTNSDAGDPDTPVWFVGDTCGPLGCGQDHADPSSPMFKQMHSHDLDVESSPISIMEKPKANVSVTFEEKDCSIGTARFTGAKPISKNLSMKGGSPMAHANVEVQLYDNQGNEVPMTRRLVRYWYVKPEAGAKVENLSQWRIVGLEHSEFSPFAVSPEREAPASNNFQWDRPGGCDAPGLQGISVRDESFGQLQEFLVGNASVGGAYFQTYTLEDSEKIRIINTNELKLSANEYRKVMRLIDTGEYSKTMRHKLFYMPQAKTSAITPYPKPTGALRSLTKP